ncbi:hypothetical protein BS17DRAFT_738892 [Gyrodon lividus]|nr:hypothetical protein BS17DRAFT_738892 [Gyrodon lividus]
MEPELSTLTQPVNQSSSPLVLPGSPTSTSIVYQVYSGPDISDEVLEQCSELFSNNYRVWGQRPAGMKGPKTGNRLRMSAARLRQQLLSSPETTFLAVCYQSTENRQLELVGHAFATAWDYDGRRVGWVTQLVVSLPVRKRYIATSLLQALKFREPFRDIMAIGLVSSHPSACHALAKYTSNHIGSIDLSFCCQNAKAIIDRVPVEYVRTMELRGSLFEPTCASGTICCVFTGFYVDHSEPLEVLAAYQSGGQWVLGDLLDRHEFLVILPVQEPTSPIASPS